MNISTEKKIVYCPECSGVITSELPMAGAVWCKCPPQKTLPIGWICPRCYTIHSPYSMVCNCPPRIESGNTNTIRE